MKIFIGMNNVASLIGDYTEGFKDLGCEVFSVTRTDHAITSNNVDLNIPVLVNGKMKRENDFSPQAKEKWTKFYNEMAWQKALEADVVFFLWSSFMEDCSDLPLLKKLGKKIIVRFAGSEVRYPPFEREFCKWSGFPYGDNNLREDIDGFKKKLHYIRMVELFADVVIGSAALSLRPSFVNGFGLFSKRDIPQRTVHNEIPIIMHAPSKRLTKGTNDWLVVFDALRANGFKFGLKIIEGIPHEQMLREYSSADIFCNSLIYSGRTAMEAMAAGCVVLDVDQPYRNKEDFKYNLRAFGIPETQENIDTFFEKGGFEYLFHAPTIKVNYENVIQKLAEIILDLPRRRKLAQKSIEYIDRLSPKNRCAEILQAMDDPDSFNTAIKSYWSPFLNLHYDATNTSMEYKKIFNAYTMMVKKCSWYKRYIQNCERGGLFF
jgi:hypothetical protein